MGRVKCVREDVDRSVLDEGEEESDERKCKQHLK